MIFEMLGDANLQYGGNPFVEATGKQRNMHTELRPGQGFDKGAMFLFRQVAMFDLLETF